MIPLERRLKILDKVKETGFASINDLTSLLNVSHMTIRRDIQKLEAEGFVVQVSGGIEVCKRLVTEPTQYEKENLAKEQKKKIAKKAVSLIKENSCIYLDAGSTTLAMCKYLDKRSDLTIVSNDFAIMNYLIDNCKSNPNTCWRPYKRAKSLLCRSYCIFSFKCFINWYSIFNSSSLRSARYYYRRYRANFSKKGSL